VWEAGGVARARRAVMKSIAQAWRQAKLNASHTLEARHTDGGQACATGEPARFEAAFLGMTGGDERTTRAIRQCIQSERFRLENDSVSALACVTAGKPGVVVIAGTGTIAYGMNARGETAKASGWGYLLGDEGGGFWIAKQAIAAACRAYDGLGEATALTPLLLQAAGVEDLWGLHGFIYSGRMSRAEMAALASVVPEAARMGDGAARRILAEAGRELGLSAAVVTEKLGMQRGRVIVGMVGGVFRGSEEVKRSFAREVWKHAPKAIFAEPRFPPVIACLLLALKMAGVRLTPGVMANLEAASAMVGAK